MQSTIRNIQLQVIFSYVDSSGDLVSWTWEKGKEVAKGANGKRSPSEETANKGQRDGKESVNSLMTGQLLSIH